MSGFLSPYEGTERIDLGRGYWVDVKKCLSAKEQGIFENAMGARQRVNITDDAAKRFADLDIRAARVELVVLSIVDWNLDDVDAEGRSTVWPLAPDKPPYSPGCQRRQSVDRLPASVFDRIYEVCNGLNGTGDTEDRVSFPDSAVGGDQDGRGGAADPLALPDGSRDVEAAGDYAGDPA